LADVMIHTINWKGISETPIAAVILEEIMLKFGKFKVAYTVQRNPSYLSDAPPGFVDFGWDIQNHTETKVDKPPAKK
jgi:hypothetical protein